MNYAWIIGLLAVLFVLLVLILRAVRSQGAAVRSLQSRLFRSGNPQPVPPHAPQGAPAGTGAPAVEAGIPEEVVAAIAAAVSCLSPGAALRSVRRCAGGPQSAWRAAGLLESTRPF